NLFHAQEKDVGGQGNHLPQAVGRLDVSLARLWQTPQQEAAHQKYQAQGQSLVDLHGPILPLMVCEQPRSASGRVDPSRAPQTAVIIPAARLTIPLTNNWTNVSTFL